MRRHCQRLGYLLWLSFWFGSAGSEHNNKEEQGEKIPLFHVAKKLVALINPLNPT